MPNSRAPVLPEKKGSRAFSVRQECARGKRVSGWKHRRRGGRHKPGVSTYEYAALYRTSELSARGATFKSCSCL
ncbi:unnamed protein product [Ectocarpus fasciculatus]